MQVGRSEELEKDTATERDQAAAQVDVKLETCKFGESDLTMYYDLLMEVDIEMTRVESCVPQECAAHEKEADQKIAIFFANTDVLDEAGNLLQVAACAEGLDPMLTDHVKVDSNTVSQKFSEISSNILDGQCSKTYNPYLNTNLFVGNERMEQAFPDISNQNSNVFNFQKVESIDQGF